MGSTAIDVPAGHRLAIHVSSSNFPKYDRNPSTRENPRLATELRSAKQTLYFGGEGGSRLVLTVLP